MRSRFILGTALCAVLLVGAMPGALAQSPAPSPTAAVVAPDGAISASGIIGLRATLGLGFGRAPAVVPRGVALSGATSPGPWVVETVSVSPGDRVEAGQVLATADPSLLQLQLDAAQAAYDLADARLAKTVAKPTEQERAKADLALAAAQQRFDAAEQSLADTEVQGRAAIDGARKTLAAAQRRLRVDRSENQLPPVIAADRSAIAAAEAALANARAAARANTSRAQQAVDAARVGLEAATADHAIATAPSAPDLVAADRSAVATAQVNLSRAQDALDGARIVAPVDGTVSLVTLAPGTVAPVGDAIQVQQGPFEVIAQVPEAMIAQVASGQPALVAVPALGLEGLTGTVLWAAPVPGSAPGQPPTYPVSIELADAPSELRLGMVAMVVIDTTAAGA
jgi:multidrug efflux pump subunit AcrA (membrane-fusion protein)